MENGLFMSSTNKAWKEDRAIIQGMNPGIMATTRYKAEPSVDTGEELYSDDEPVSAGKKRIRSPTPEIVLGELENNLDGALQTIGWIESW